MSRANKNRHLPKNNLRGQYFFGSSTLVCWGKSTNYNIYIYAAYIYIYICRLYPNNPHIYSIYIPLNILNILSIIYTLIYRFLVRTGSRILRSLGACWGKQHRWPPQLPGPQWDWNISNLFSKTWGWVKSKPIAPIFRGINIHEPAILGYLDTRVLMGRNHPQCPEDLCRMLLGRFFVGI